MKIAFAGSPHSAIAVLESLAQHHEVVAVLTKEDAPVGRRRILTPSAVAVAAEQFGLPVLKRNRPTGEDAAWIRAQGAEVCVVVAYGALLRPEVLNLGPRFINLHFSLLPKFRGAAPVQRAILAGELETGISIFEIDAGLDTGPLLSQVRVGLEGTETTATLLHELTELAIPELLRVLESPMATYPQAGVPSLAPKVTKLDGRIFPADCVLAAHTKFRALSEEPGVWLETTAGVLSLIEIELAEHPEWVNNSGPKPLAFVQRSKQLFLTDGSETAIRLATVRPAGKQRMAAMDWWRGLREVAEIA